MYVSPRAPEKGDLKVEHLDLVDADKASIAQARAVSKETSTNPAIVNGVAVTIAHLDGAYDCHIPTRNGTLPRQGGLCYIVHRRLNGRRPKRLTRLDRHPPYFERS